MDVNRFARSSTWAHGAVAAFAQRDPASFGIGLCLLAALVLATWWSARRASGALVAVLWAALSGAAAFALALPLASALARPRPYQALKHVEVLVPSHGYGFPDPRLAACGAVVCGLALARRWLALSLAVLVTVAIGLADVYVGTDYPSDVAGGAVFGAALCLVAWPLASWALGAVLGWLALSPLRRLVQPAGVSAPGRLPSLPARRQLRAGKMPNTAAMEALRNATEAGRARPSGGTEAQQG